MAGEDQQSHGEADDSGRSASHAASARLPAWIGSTYRCQQRLASATPGGKRPGAAVAVGAASPVTSPLASPVTNPGANRQSSPEATNRCQRMGVAAMPHYRRLRASTAYRPCQPRGQPQRELRRSRMKRRAASDDEPRGGPQAKISRATARLTDADGPRAGAATGQRFRRQASSTDRCQRSRPTAMPDGKRLCAAIGIGWCEP